jgi:hypothetical protein
MFEPTTLYIARSVCPFNAPVKLTSSSGAEVPTATTVNPMTKEDSFNLRAMEILDEMRILPLKMSKTKPSSRRRYCIGGEA